MNQDREHLRLLAIFHYVVAGTGRTLFSFSTALHNDRHDLIFAAKHGTAKPGEDLPPEFLGWIFAVIGSVLFLIRLAMAICILIAGPVSNSPRKALWSAVHLLSVQCFGTAFFDVQSTRLTITILVNLNPAAARMTPCARGHPNHVLPAFRTCICLRCRCRF